MLRYSSTKADVFVSSEFIERLLDALRSNDAEFEESDDEEDVQKQRTGTASQKRPRMEAEESAPQEREAASEAMAVDSAPAAAEVASGSSAVAEEKMDSTPANGTSEATPTPMPPPEVTAVAVEQPSAAIPSPLPPTKTVPPSPTLEHKTLPAASDSAAVESIQNGTQAPAQAPATTDATSVEGAAAVSSN